MKTTTIINRPIILILLCFITMQLNAQLIITTGVNATQAVDTLVGPGVTFLNPTFTGANVAAPGFSLGTFKTGATATNLGLTSGIVLCSGKVNSIPAAASNGLSNSLSGNSDADLTEIAGNTSKDAAVLEFDFVPLSNSISFRYVFASEEYPTYVCSDYNDAFGFFISGPGITGPYSNNSKNIALVPSQTYAVAINSVNVGTIGSSGCTVSLFNPTCPDCFLTNSSYFVNNTAGTQIIFNGFTTVLTATCAVTACQTYHIKLAVSDAGDQILDSGVFLEANSFTDNSVGISPSYSNNTVSSNSAIENCSSAIFKFSIPAPIATPTTINYTIGGTAINGVDYTTIPTSVVIPAGSTFANVIITPLQDALTEGTEKVVLSFQASACGFKKDSIQIIDNTPLIVSASATPSTVCQNAAVNLNSTVSGGIILPTLPYTYTWSNGATTATTSVNPSSVGTVTYTVNVLDACGSMATASTTVTVNDCNCTSWITPTNIKCHGQATGSATVTATSFLGNPFTYQWNTGSTASTLNGISAGVYTVTATTTGCVTTATITITEPPLLTASTTFTTVSCNGGNNGSATVISTGGAGTHDYLWTATAANQTTATASNLTQGTYVVTVTDDSLCTVTASATIIEPMVLIANNTSTNVTCNGLNNGITTITTSGGMGTPTYLWPATAGNQVAANVTNLMQGTYIVTVTDANSCKAYTTVTITEPTLLTASNSVNNNVSCFNGNNGSATVSSSGGTGTAGYQWPATAANQTTATVSNLQDGTYIVTVTDANSCKAYTTVTITEPLQLIASIGLPNNVSCFGGNDGSATASTLGGTGVSTYQWPTTAANQNLATASNLLAGIYTVTATDANLCPATATVTITQPPLLTASISPLPTNVSCFGGSDGLATVVYSGGTIIPTPPTYLWPTTAGNQATATANNLKAGSYIVTVTDVKGCTATATANITEPTQVTIGIGTPVGLTCNASNDGKITISASGGTGAYTYSAGGAIPTNHNGQFADLAPGQYTITVTDANGCYAVSQSITITEPTPVAFTSSAFTNITCFGRNDGTITVTAAGGTGTIVYSIGFGGSNTTGTFTGLAPGQYSIIAKDQNQCNTSIIINITQPPQLTVNIIGAQNICMSQILNLLASPSGGTGACTYVWSNNATTPSIQVSPMAATTYSVVVTDASGCTATDQDLVTVNPPLSVSLYTANDTICPGDATVIQVNASGGNEGPYTITMDGAMVSPPLTVYPLQTTTYTVVLNDDCGTPAATAAIKITVLSPPPIGFVSDIIKGCRPLTVHFNETSTEVQESYLWNFNDIYGSSSASNKNPIHTFEVAGNYDISLTIITSYGCKSTFLIEDMITVYPTPTASFDPKPSIVSIIEPIVYFDNNSLLSALNVWSFADGDSSSAVNPIHEYTEVGEYNVELLVISEYGCVDSITSIVTIRDEFTFYAPTAFSPDMDGVNDVFNVFGNGINPKEFNLKIYDRWGELIFETSEYDLDASKKPTKGWDGCVKDKKIGEVGSYSWICTYRDLQGIEHQKAGMVSLIR